MSANYTQFYTYPEHSVGNTIKTKALTMQSGGVDLVLNSAIFVYRKRGTSTATTVTLSFAGAVVTLPEFNAAATTTLGPGTFDFYVRTVETGTLLSRDYLAGSFTLTNPI